MLHKFQNFCTQNHLYSSTDEILVAVSGGVDSMVLMHLMANSGLKFGIAHCNFQLRAAASDGDEALVKQTAANLNLKCHIERFDTYQYIKDEKISLQQAARDLRYRWFDSICEQYGYDKIATAHHASDQTETILYNIIKGCGIAGLRGIPLVNDNIIRPLLFATRQEIVSYAKENNLDWREDASNNNEKYNRNLIRHSVVPRLKQINPGIDKTMLRNATRYRALEELIDSEIDKVKIRHLSTTPEGYVLSTNWTADQKGGVIILEGVLKEFGFNYEQVSSVYSSLTSHSGKVFYSDGFKLNVDRSSIYIYPISEDDDILIEIEEKDSGFEVVGSVYEMTTLPVEKFKMIKNPRFACLDFDKLVFPLKIRNWQQGDRFMPLGMNSKKKLSDFMIDEKIPVNLKSRVVLLESQNDIVWIAGYRIDNRYKITAQTKQVLIIEKTDVQSI